MTSRPVRQLRAGTAVFIRVEIRDLTDETQPLYTPSNPTTLTLIKPDGVAALSNQNMAVAGVGIATYTHQTATTDPRGVWRVSFKIADTSTSYSVPEDAFDLVP